MVVIAAIVEVLGITAVMICNCTDEQRYHAGPFDAGSPGPVEPFSLAPEKDD